VFATGSKIDKHLVIANGDKLDGIENSMRQLPDALGDPKAAQDRPARWIQAIAANFLTRESLALEKDSAQSRGGAKCRTGRSGGPAADDCDIKYFHRASLSKKRARIKAISHRRWIPARC